MHIYAYNYFVDAKKPLNDYIFFIKINLDCDTSQFHWYTRLEMKFAFFWSETTLNKYSIHKEDVPIRWL